MSSIAHVSSLYPFMHLTEAFLSHQAGHALLRWLLAPDEVCWVQEHLTMFGRSTPVPRRVAWFGDDGVNYRYSGQDHCCRGWPEPLCNLRNRVEDALGCSFNFVLLNRYDHGSHGIGWHRDDERGCAPRVASLSLGAPRRFRLLDELRSEPVEIALPHGSLLDFDGRMRHTLPRTRRPTGLRVNLTFRTLAA